MDFPGIVWVAQTRLYWDDGKTFNQHTAYADSQDGAIAMLYVKIPHSRRNEVKVETKRYFREEE